MIMAIPMLAFSAALFFFAFIGIKTTIEKHQGGHGLNMVADLFKYAALFIAVVIASFGLAGLITQLIDNSSSSLDDKLDAARWLSFVFVGVPIIAIIGRWIRKDFTKNTEASHEPAWQLYLLVATTFSFMVWFIPLADTLKWFAGGTYHPRQVAQILIAFVGWLIHLKLIAVHESSIVNIHRFIGWFSGAIGLVVSGISLIDWVISKAIDVQVGPLQIQEAVILAAVSAPIFAFYWGKFEENASEIEGRIYRTFGGMAVPILFSTIALTFAIHQFLSWHFEDRYDDYQAHFAEVPQQIGVVVILIPTMLIFRKLVSGHERDNVNRAFQYLISAGGVLAMGLSLGALLEGTLDRTDRDSLLFAFALIISAGYTWYRQWSHCQFAMSIDFEVEHHSPIRRLFLLATIGIPSLISIGAATWLLYRILEALFIGEFDQIRIAQPAGFIFGAGAVALYHLRIARKERD